MKRPSPADKVTGLFNGIKGFRKDVVPSPRPDACYD